MSYAGSRTEFGPDQHSSAKRFTDILYKTYAYSISHFNVKFPCINKQFKPQAPALLVFLDQTRACSELFHNLGPWPLTGCPTV